MIFRTQSRRTLALRPPAHCEDTTRATERWLLSLWQSERKHSWRLWRRDAAVSLEYAGSGDGLAMQASMRGSLAADLSRNLLVSLLPGVDLVDQDALGAGCEPGTSIATTTFTLRSPGWLDLPKDTDPEGVVGLLAALDGLREGETALLQFLLEPAWMRTEDGRQPAFWLAGRIVATSSSQNRAMHRARLVAGALGQFSGLNGLHVGSIRDGGQDELRAAGERRWTRKLLPPGHVATTAQVATLFHPPADARRAGRLVVAGARKTPAVTSIEGVALGEGRDYLGRTAPIRVDPRALLQHAFVLGPSGAGKSTLIAQLARELAVAGYGVTVFDPHGSLATDIARMLPATRLADSALIRFADTAFPIALNPLLPRKGQESLAADGLVEVLQRVQSRAAWGPLLDLVLRHAALASIAVGGTIADTARLLEDPWYRERVVDSVRDERTATFLRQLGDADAFDRRLLPAVHRLERLLATPILRNILTQPRPGLDFAEAFERRRILLLDLSGAGATNTRLLGSLLLLLIRQAVFGGSPPIGEPRHFVLIDEASWFLSRTVSELFDQARKYGVGFVVVAQRLGQLQPEDVREAVFANAATFATFRVNERDEAATVAKHLGGELIGTSDLQRLPDYEAYVRFSRAGALHEPSWLRTLTPPPTPTDAAARVARLIENGRRWYARPVHEVEAELGAAAATLADDEPEIAPLAPPGPRFLPTPRDRQILEAVRTHGRLTSRHVRRLFFRRLDGRLATIQAVHTRLRKLVASGYLESSVVNGGHGSGPWAYGLGPNARLLFQRLNAPPSFRGRNASGPVWHALEIAEFRVRLQEELEREGGRLVEWLGEPAIRALLLGRRGWPVPDAFVHWQLHGREGTFLLEWDRETESMAILVQKLQRYAAFWRAHGHRQFLPGLRLRPRLAIVVATEERRERLVRWAGSHPISRSTVAIGVAPTVISDSIGRSWWRSNAGAAGRLFD